MKNKSLEVIKSKIKLRVSGKNVNRYLLRLSKNHISLLSVLKKSKDEYDILIYFKVYSTKMKFQSLLFVLRNSFIFNICLIVGKCM